MHARKRDSLIMVLSTTTNFNPDFGDLVEEAFEMAGLEALTGNDLRTARRSLNYLLLEWHNKGINLWTVDEDMITSSTIVAGTHTYDVDIDTISILDAVIRTDHGNASLQTDLTLSRISGTTYSQIPNKLQTGRPIQYYFSRKGIRDAGGNDLATVTFWPVPDLSNKYTFVYWRIQRMIDAGTYAGETMQVPDRFLPALVAGLAYRIAAKKPQAAGRAAVLKQEYLELFKEAADEDREKTSLFITPDLSGYGQ